jgi:hypothetical protein
MFGKHCGGACRCGPADLSSSHAQPVPSPGTGAGRTRSGLSRRCAGTHGPGSSCAHPSEFRLQCHSAHALGENIDRLPPRKRRGADRGLGPGAGDRGKPGGSDLRGILPARRGFAPFARPPPRMPSGNCEPKRFRRSLPWWIIVYPEPGTGSSSRTRCAMSSVWTCPSFC